MENRLTFLPTSHLGQNAEPARGNKGRALRSVEISHIAKLLRENVLKDRNWCLMRG
jgi:hypothetical protein